MLYIVYIYIFIYKYIYIIMHINDADSNTNDIDRQTYLSTTRSFMSINKSITFMHISRLILVSKSPPFTFFIWIFTHSITFLHRRFVHIHTFFHYKMMCNCLLATCLYDIQQTSSGHRLHHNHVALSVPIWAEFISILGKICPLSIRAATPVLFVCAAPPRLYIGIYYWGKIRST